MRPREIKEVCDLISLVAQAISTNTIEEAEDYLLEKYDDPNDPIFQHVFNVLDEVKQQSESNVTIHAEFYYG